MSTLLDLRPKLEPQIKIVERIVLKRRTWYVESLKMLFVIGIVSTIVWGVSKADSFDSQDSDQAAIKNFSAIGIVSDNSADSLSIDQASGSDDSSSTSYTFNTGNVTKIETEDYTPLVLSDIVVGDKIIVQGTVANGSFDIHRIISFGLASSTEEVTATSTLEAATSTEATSTDTIDPNATSTEDMSTSTADSDAGTSTSDVSPIISTSTDTSGTSTDSTASSTIGDIVNGVVQNIVDFFTGTSTPPEDTSGDSSTTTSPDPAPTDTSAPADTPSSDPAPAV